jgi:nucleoside triphosphatase
MRSSSTIDRLTVDQQPSIDIKLPSAIIPSRYPLPAVAALIAAPSNRVLIVRTHKWSGLWGVPGGKVDYGEGLEPALRREMLEEVGLELFDVRFAFIAELIEDPHFHKPMHFVSMEYVARTQGEYAITNEEIAEHAWVTVSEAFNYPINQYTQKLLEWCQLHNWPGSVTP